MTFLANKNVTHGSVKKKLRQIMYAMYRSINERNIRYCTLIVTEVTTKVDLILSALIV